MSYQALVESGDQSTQGGPGSIEGGPVGGHPEEIGVYPLDEHNARLLDLVAPADWRNPSRPAGYAYDLLAIGAGAGGLVASKQTARRCV